MKHGTLNRFPLKHAWDALALGQVLLRGDQHYGVRVGLGNRLKCVDFYFRSSNVRRLLATLTRSGTHWSQLTMHLALDLANGGDGEYSYSGLFWPHGGIPYRRLDWRVPLGTEKLAYARPDGPAFDKLLYFHSHHPYFRIRSAQLKKMKTVVITRSILESLESKYFKFSKDPTERRISLDDEDSFDWDRFLTDEIEFYNSWGDVMTWHPNVRHFTYHQLTADPVAGFKEILDFWDLGVPLSCVEEAVRRTTKQAMKSKIEASTDVVNLQVSYRGKDKRGVLSEDRKRYIINRLKRELIHNLGYEYDFDTEYGFMYE
jgi:hypothetical protein